MIVKLYANYGVLAHEKEPQFTTDFLRYHAAYIEPVAVEIPDEWIVGRNPYDELLVSADGMGNSYYRLREVLNNHGDNPVIAWHDEKNGKYRYRKLRLLGAWSDDFE